MPVCPPAIRSSFSWLARATSTPNIQLMKTVAIFWKTEDAHLLRIRLGSEGIPAFLQDENATQMHPWRAAAVGGVRVQVPEAHFEAAQKILAGFELPAAAETVLGEPNALDCCACKSPMSPDQTRCPACGWSYEDEPEGPSAKTVDDRPRI